MRWRLTRERLSLSLLYVLFVLPERDLNQRGVGGGLLFLSDGTGRLLRESKSNTRTETARAPGRPDLNNLIVFFLFFSPSLFDWNEVVPWAHAMSFSTLLPERSDSSSSSLFFYNDRGTRAMTDVEELESTSIKTQSFFSRLWLGTSFIISRTHLICPRCSSLFFHFFLSFFALSVGILAKDEAIIHQNPAGLVPILYFYFSKCRRERIETNRRENANCPNQKFKWKWEIEK